MKWFDPSDSSEEEESDTEDLETQLQEFLKRPEEQESEQPVTQEEPAQEEEQEESEQPVKQEEPAQEEEEEEEQEEPEEEEDPEWARGDQLGGNFYLDMSDKATKNSKGFAFF